MHTINRIHRCRTRIVTVATILTFATFTTMSASLCAETPDINLFLKWGKFADGITALQMHLKNEPKDDVARFGLGILQFVHSIEQLGQSLSVYGIQTRGNARLSEVFPEPSKPPAEPITYKTLRGLIQNWHEQLATAEQTLAGVQSETVKLPITVGSVRLRMAPGATQLLSLVPLLQMFQLGPSGREADFTITFDRADVDWLRGYCHLTMAFCEISLAYDGQGLFDVFAHRLFKHAKVPHEFLYESGRNATQTFFPFEEIADVIAAIHMLRFPLVEPKRTASALAHIETTIALSREMWKRVLAETDDDREWIPNPKQKGAININVTDDMVEKWMVALDEFQLILQGKKLLPFWRGKTTRGINLRKAFLEPTQLDIVLWIQGTGAIPYLEEGELTSPDTWNRINQSFGGQFLGFGFWFN